MLFFIIIIAIVLYFVIKNKMERDEQEQRRMFELQRIKQEADELNAFLDRKKKVIDSSKLYPHAFYELTQNLHIAEIPGTKITLPGTRIKGKTERKKSESDKTKRDSFKQQGRAVLKANRKKVFPVNSPDLSGSVIRYSSLLDIWDIWENGHTLSSIKSGRSIDSLSKDEYETLFQYLDTLPNREKILKKELHKEDIEIEFTNKVLCNKKRSKFYKQFLASQQNVTDEKEFCVANLFKLDGYITSKSRDEYSRIKREYPEAIEYFESFGFPRNDSKEEYVVANEDRIIEINKVIDRYLQLKEKYPVGLPAFEKDYAWFDGIICTELTIEQIVECEDEIAKYEEKKADDYFYKHWQETQNEFNTKCLKLRDSSLSDWWCYSYKVPLFIPLPQKDSKSTDISVWQIFYESYSEDETVNTSYYPEKNTNREKIPQLLNNLKQYPQFVYSKILSFIIAIKNIYPKENIVVLFSCSQKNNNSTIIEAHFDYLKTELDNRNIPNYIITESTKYSSGKQKYIIVDLVTGNSNLKRNVSRIIQNTLLFRNSIKANNNDKQSYYADIVYISLLKGFDKDEMLSLNDKKRIEEENEIRRKRNEENQIKSRAESIYNNYRKGFVYYANLGKIKSWSSCSSISDYQKIIEFESQCRIKHEELQKKDRLNQLKGCVKDWHVTRYGIAHNYLYDYLKTKAPREASESEWDIRNLIWAFKNNPEKVNKHYSYNQALDIIIPKYENELKRTFGSYLSDLTLVCIPASSTVRNERRWREFSKKVCSDLGMKNAYDYISITREATPKSMGGDGHPSLSFDSAFFKGEMVVLCDDIKTTGASLQRMREKLESLGAVVICSLTIGKTIHE